MLYFDHNATTPVAPEVAEAFVCALREAPGNASSSHRAGQIARQKLEQARITVSRALGASAQEIVFTSGGTEANNLAIFGLLRKQHTASRHVVTTSVEHPAVLEPVRQLAREGVEITIAPPTIAGVACALRPETVLVSIMHANNETGCLLPVGEVGRLVRERRVAGQTIYLHSDGVQAFGKIATDVNALGVDLYSLSAHKIYGPKGVGALFVRKGTPLGAIHFGGSHQRGLRPGTENVAGAVALGRACELLEHSPNEVQMLRDRFEEQLARVVVGIEINGASEPRLPNTSNVLFRDVSGEAMLIALDTAGFAVSTGSACSSGAIAPSHVLLAMGRTVEEARSSIRFSFGRGNTQHDVDMLRDAVRDCVQRLRKSRHGKAHLALH